MISSPDEVFPGRYITSQRGDAPARAGEPPIRVSDPPTDDELLSIECRAADDGAGSDWRAGRRRLFEVGEAAAAARYRAELADAHTLADGLLTERDQARADLLRVGETLAQRIRDVEVWRRRHADERARAENDQSANDEQYLTLQRERDDQLDEMNRDLRAATDRADKAVALAAEMSAELTKLVCLDPDESSPRYATLDALNARLAALRGDTGEGRDV